MTAIQKTLISEHDYLEEERKALNKSEYYKGEVFAMTGATQNHNRIVASIIITIGQYLKNKNCHIYPGDLRVHNPENGLYTYPDVTIACGKEEYLDEEFDTLLNPTVLIEVLSPTTENYDRGTKFKLYRSIPSLKNYIMVSISEVSAEVYTRMDNDEWNLSLAKDKEGMIHISAIDYDLSLKDVYAQVEDLIPNWSENSEIVG